MAEEKKTKKSAPKAAAKKSTAEKKSASSTKTAAAKKKTATKSTTKAPKKGVKAAAKKTQPKTDKFEKKITFRVQRGESVDGKYKSWTEEFEVPYTESTTVLQGLEYIKGYEDGTLTFRRSCRASICGSCGMFINNRSRLACKTKIKDIAEGSKDANRRADAVVEIGPQKNQPVLKDMVVDIREFYKKVDDITPYVKEGPEADKDVTKDSFEQVNMVSNCIMCGACYSDCTAMVENPDFLGPAALAKAFRFVSDPRDGEKTERLKELSEENGIWDCTRCGLCVDACPKDVAPMEAIVKLRTRAMERGVRANRGARHAMAFKSDIKNFGLLNEPLLLLKTLGPSVFGQMGHALHLAKKGKIPSPFPHKVEGLDEIKSIYAELEANPIDVETKQEDSGPGAG